MTDTEHSVWTPNSCEPHHGEKECNHDGCRADADWDVQLLGEGPRQGQTGLVRACDDHVAEYWGYHPEDEELVTDGGTDTERIGEAPLHPSDESPQLRYCHHCVGNTLHGWDGDCWVCESCGQRWSK